MRIGIGYDIHRLTEGRRLVLGGVEFPGPVGLEAHSDGDVVLHAVADAMLGAASLGDLGEHFPDSDERWRDADSAQILAIVVGMLGERGLTVSNLDVNVIAERPKIAPRRSEMQRRIASVLRVPPGRVNVKGRTAEGLGPVGRGEAIEVQAVVLLDESGPARGKGDA